MLFLPVSSSFTMVPKTGQTTQKTGKKVEQKKLKSTTSTQKKEKADNGVSEADQAIIRAAENYHNLISPPKPVPQKTVPIKAATQKEKFKNNEKSTAKVTGKVIQKGQPIITEQTAQVYPEGIDPNLNIYTGNPGIYFADGDTLNFWNISKSADSPAKDSIVVVQSPTKPYGFEGKLLKKSSQDWTFGMVIIGWIIFASLRFRFSKYINQVFLGIFSYTTSSRLYREKGYQQTFGLFRMNLLFYLFLPFSVFLVVRMLDATMMGLNSMLFYLLIFAVLNGYILIKIFFYWLTGTIFSHKDATRELIFNMMLYYNIMGLLLLPISSAHALLQSFGMVAQFLVPAIILLLYLLSLVRSIYFALREGISIFYLILYLCALEILPVILVIKITTSG